MVECPYCGNPIDGEHIACEFRCSSTETWWCESCGSIAIMHDGEEPDQSNWTPPNNIS